MSAQKSCMASTPSFLNFQTKVSFILWAEYNLIVAVDALRGFTDLSALFSIFAVTTLLAIKMRQFIDHTKTETDSEPQMYFDTEIVKDYAQCVTKSINKGIHILVSMDSLQCYLRFFGGVFAITVLLSLMSTCTIVFLAVNAAFALSFAKNSLKIDVCQMCEVYMKKANDLTKVIQIPKYKESKKNI